MTHVPLVDRDQPYKLDEQLVVSLCQFKPGTHSLVAPNLGMIGAMAATEPLGNPSAGIDTVHHPAPLSTVVDHAEQKAVTFP
jgi:hypothetical protein